jgi:hypothetical protein
LASTSRATGGHLRGRDRIQRRFDRRRGDLGRRLRRAGTIGSGGVSAAGAAAISGGSVGRRRGRLGVEHRAARGDRLAGLLHGVAAARQRERRRRRGDRRTREQGVRHDCVRNAAVAAGSLRSPHRASHRLPSRSAAPPSGPPPARASPPAGNSAFNGAFEPRSARAAARAIAHVPASLPSPRRRRSPTGAARSAGTPAGPDPGRGARKLLRTPARQRLTFVNGSVRQGVPIPPMMIAMEAVP